MNTQPFTKRIFTYLFLPLSLASITTITYYPSLRYDFQFDDIINIKKHFGHRSGTLKTIAFKNRRWMSYWVSAICYRLGKFDPFYYRTFNVFFHTLAGLLLFFFLLLALGRCNKTSFFFLYRIPIAYTSAALFLIHPVQTQTVSYVIQGQLEGLALFFILAIVTTYLAAYTVRNQVIRYALLGLTCMLGFLSTGSKEIAIISPLLLLLVDWFFVAHGSAALFILKTPFFVLYTAIVAKEYYRYLGDNLVIIDSFKGQIALNNNIGNVITESAHKSITGFDYFISQFKVILHYITMFVWPFNISVDYDWKMVPSFWATDCILPLCILLCIGAFTLFLLYKNKASFIAFAILWFFIGIAPRSTFIPSTELLADYKTYISSLGVIVLLAAALVYLFTLCTNYIRNRSARRVASGLFPLAALSLICFATYQRNTVWRSAPEFWVNIVKNSPNKARGYNNYAVALAEQGRQKEAIPYLRKAIKMDRNYPDPWNNISVCYNALGKTDIAIHFMQEALKINPTYPEFYNNLASYFLNKKEYEKSIEHAKYAIKLRPYYGKAHFNWGRALYESGRKEEALEKIKLACCKCDYDVPEAFNTYAQIAVELQRFQDAVVGYSNVLALAPHHDDTRFNLANAHFFSGNVDTALELFTQLTQKNPKEYRSWINLSECYMRKKDYKMAYTCIQNALPLEPHFPQIKDKLRECQLQLGIQA